MKQLLEGKVALVTGGGSGIGAATAEAYAREGAQVLIADLHLAAAQEVQARIQSQGGTAWAVSVDVSNAADCERMVQEALSRFGRLDIACNNAGIGGEANPVADMSLDGWRRIIAVNLDSVFYCMKYQIPAMLQHGGGAIVNMSSILGQVAFPYSSGYVAAKHGVVGLTQNAAVEYATAGIRVNAVGPAFIDTPLLSALDASVKQQLITKHPIGRLGKAEEVAELVLWLSSDKASFVTGSYYAVDGGYLSV